MSFYRRKSLASGEPLAGHVSYIGDPIYSANRSQTKYMYNEASILERAQKGRRTKPPSKENVSDSS